MQKYFMTKIITIILEIIVISILLKLLDMEHISNDIKNIIYAFLFMDNYYLIK